MTPQFMLMDDGTAFEKMFFRPNDRLLTDILARYEHG